MTTKSKHKPVTFAKSASDFSVSVDLPDTATSEVIDAAGEDKSVAKPVKASKSKAGHDMTTRHAKSQSDDVIAVYRNLADRSLDQARNAFVKARHEAEALSGKIEESSTALTHGTTAVQSYVVKAMQSQADDLFGYFRALAETKTLSDVIELQSSQSRKTLDASLRQFKDLSAIVNDMAVKAAQPIRSALPLVRS